MPSPTKARRYDSSRRAEQARRNRDRIVDVARREFLRRGYAATTIATIAGKARVSEVTIFKQFGGKPGLVRAMVERGLAGAGPTPAPVRSDAAMLQEADPREIVRHWGTLVAEVSPRVSPILLLVREAAATDPVLADVRDEIDAARLARMRHNARALARRGFLRRGLTPAKAADVMWALTSPDLYGQLVDARGWSAAAFGDFVAAVMAATLLPP
jgi:AcrR family transcriptional regulator